MKKSPDERIEKYESFYAKDEESTTNGSITFLCKSSLNNDAKNA